MQEDLRLPEIIQLTPCQRPHLALVSLRKTGQRQAGRQRQECLFRGRSAESRQALISGIQSHRTGVRPWDSYTGAHGLPWFRIFKPLSKSHCLFSQFCGVHGFQGSQQKARQVIKVAWSYDLPPILSLISQCRGLLLIRASLYHSIAAQPHLSGFQESWARKLTEGEFFHSVYEYQVVTLNAFNTLRFYLSAVFQ